MTDADWLAAVAAAPDDPLVRLMYADWLDDCGDPRGELLRLDVELFARPDDGRLYDRLRELAAKADVVWRAAACRVPLEYELDPDGIDEFPWYPADFCTCPVPGRAAPALCGSDTVYGHWPIRQPRTPAETAALCRAARGCERQVIRYGGQDPVVIGQLGNIPDRSDYLIDENTSTIYRATTEAFAERLRTGGSTLRPSDEAMSGPEPAPPVSPPDLPKPMPSRSVHSGLAAFVPPLTDDPDFLPLPGSRPDGVVDEVAQSGCLLMLLAAITTLVGLLYSLRNSGRL